jgi:hypothetical protein
MLKILCIVVVTPTVEKTTKWNTKRSIYMSNSIEVKSVDYVLFKDGQEFEVFDNMDNAIEEAIRCFDDELAEVYSYLGDIEIERIY